MKLFIAVTCLLTVASAGHLGLTAYSYPAVVHAQHIPVIGPNGVPVDEPAVAIAKAAHAAAHIEAKARNGDVPVVAPYAYGAYGAHVAGPVAVAVPAVYTSHYAGPQHLPVIGANGVPVDEPAVSAARAHHAAAHVEAKVRNGDVAIVAAPVATYTTHVAAPISSYAADVAAPVTAYAAHIAAHGVPHGISEVAVAEAADFAAHVEAKVRNGAFHHYSPLVHYRKRRGLFHGYSATPLAYAAPVAHYAAPLAHYAGPQHIPVIGANGVPVEEPAVAIAKAEHAVAHVEAAVRNGDVAHVAVAPVATYAGHVAPVVHVATPVAHYAGPQHLPVIGANGVPVDEPAVSAARAHHAAAHVEAKVRNGDVAVVAPVVYAASHYGAHGAYAAGHIAAPVVHYAGAQHLPVIGANGVPVEEPAVVAARAHHAAAHIEAKVRNGDAAFVAPVAYAAGHIAAPVVHAW